MAYSHTIEHYFHQAMKREKIMKPYSSMNESQNSIQTLTRKKKRLNPVHLTGRDEEKNLIYSSHLQSENLNKKGQKLLKTIIMLYISIFTMITCVDMLARNHRTYSLCIHCI